MERLLLLLAGAGILAIASPVLAQDGSEMTASRTPETAVRFLNLIASQGKMSLRPMTAMTEITSWDVACGGGECSLGSPKTQMLEIGSDSSSVEFGEYAACKTPLLIKNSSEEYKNNVLEKRGEGWVHTMAFRKYTVKVPGSITRNHWVKAVRDLEGHAFDWSGVRKVTPGGGQYTYHLVIANDRAPGGGVRLFFGDDSELRNRAQLAIDVIVKSCDPLADSGF